MRVAIYGNEVKESYLPIYKRIFDFSEKNHIELILLQRIKSVLIAEYGLAVEALPVFGEKIKMDDKADILLSIGGDGTFLSSVPYVLECNIPIAGINCGRLGFLADISSENLEGALLQIINGEFTLEKRSLLQVFEPVGCFNGFNYALNELTVHKLDNSSMIQIETYINGEFLANYWADGLIVSTPTGSTAYSLSVGGPIVMPDLEGLVITPIAPHNLTVRPIVVPDDVEVELRVTGRGQQFLVSFDHRSIPFDFSSHIKVRKAPAKVSVVKLKGQSFYSTLRNKLMWGMDKRN